MNRSGIVYISATGVVSYKFDLPPTSSLPTLSAGEAIALRPDCDDILVGAQYNPATDTYINPTRAPIRNWKDEFAAASTATAKIALIAERLQLA